MSTTKEATAYLVSQYPAWSHVFIEREVDALRDLGHEIVTLSVQPPGVPGHRHAAQTLVIGSGGWRGLALVLARLMLRHPVPAVHVLGRSLRSERSRRRGLGGYARQLAYLSYAARLFELLRPGSVRHVHVHFANNAADVAMMMTELGNAVSSDRWTWSLAVHGPSDFDHATEFGLSDKAASAAFVTCISQYAREKLRLTYGVAESRITMVPMGVDDSYFLTERAISTTPSPPAVHRILFVGRIVPVKGVDVLLNAVGALAEKRPEASLELAVIGAGPLLEALERRSRNLPDNVRVEWMGAQPVDVVRAEFSRADYFCLPSYSEGLPVVLMEALASGLPAIATPVAGIPELIEHGVTGLLVEPGDAVAIAEALESLMDDPSRRRLLADAGRQRVHSQYRTADSALILAELLRRTSSARESRG